MKNGISFRQYRSIDLFLFLLMLTVSETVIVKASTVWIPGSVYVISPVAAVTTIVLLRWGPWAALHAAAGGLVYCLLLGGGLPQLGVYVLGNMGGMAGLLLGRFRNGDTLPRSTGALMALGLTVQGGMLLGRALMALVTGLGADMALKLIATDTLSFVFTLVVLWIAARVNGLL